MKTIALMLLGAGAVAPDSRPACRRGRLPRPAASSSSTTPRSRSNEPGTHNGGGQTVGYSFFSKVPNLKLVFRKRAFKPGSGVGHHVQKEDEIYYVLSGTGTMVLDGKTVDITPGTAVLTRPGSSHSLKQTGTEDSVVLINYEVQPRPAKCEYG